MKITKKQLTPINLWWKVILKVLLYFCIFAISLAVPTILVRIAKMPDTTIIGSTPFTYFFYYVVISVPLFLGLSYLVIRWQKLSFHQIFLVRPTYATLFYGLLGLVLPVVILCFYLFSGMAEQIKLITPFSSKDFVEIFAISLIPATSGSILEEITFRGLVFQELEKKWGAKIAILTPSVIFALIHVRNIELSTLIPVLFTFAVGVLFGLIVYYTRNVWNTILLHFCWNLIFVGRVVKFNYNDPQLSDTPSLINFNIKTSNTLFTGGFPGVEYAFPSLVAIVIVMIGIVALYRNDKKGRNS